jgi:rubrerythrin
MTDQSALVALATAQEAEKESLRDYLHYAWQTRDPGGRRMFIRLALDEFEHLRLLEHQQAEFDRVGAWRPTELAPSIVEQLVPRLSEGDVRIRGTDGQTDIAALRTALDLEQRAARFYAAQADSNLPESGRKLYQRLADMERAHAALLQAELDSIQQDGFWFGLAEFTLESERT